jgi:hypothetical protein
MFFAETRLRWKLPTSLKTTTGQVAAPGAEKHKNNIFLCVLGASAVNFFYYTGE